LRPHIQLLSDPSDSLHKEWKHLAVLPLLFTFLLLSASATFAFDHSHRGFKKVLTHYVADGNVNYAALKESASDLDEYLRDLAAVSVREFRQWKEVEQLSYFINLYNFSLFQLCHLHWKK